MGSRDVFISALDLVGRRGSVVVPARTKNSFLHYEFLPFRGVAATVNFRHE